MTTLQPFARPKDVQVLLPGLDDAQAELVVDLVSATIREHVRWAVDWQAGLTYSRVVARTTRAGWPHRGTAAGPLLSVTLPAMHVTAVQSVNVDGLVLLAGQYELEPAGVVYVDVPVWRRIDVVYDAGFVRAPQDQAPPVFRSVCLDLATRLADNPTGSGSYVMGVVQENLSVASDLLASDQRLDRYRIESL